jgi:hypothetical protein
MMDDNDGDLSRPAATALRGQKDGGQRAASGGGATSPLYSRRHD